MRFDPPVQAQEKLIVQDICLGGQRLGRGQTVTVLLGSACHDPAQFIDPGRLRLDRRPNRHLALGDGPHRCLGASLDMAQAKGSLPLLARHAPRLHPTGPPVREPNPVLRGITAAPLRLT
ncbi:cytochrome P450 [Actinomadura sp. J1-007]|nr:cytochrome P450 [Actinomadura sp. J1-007]